MPRRLVAALAALLLFVPAVLADDALPVPGDPDPARIPGAQATRPSRAALRHILVSFKGAQQADPAVLRTKEEAQVRAAQLVALARAKDGDFPSLATKYSDDQHSSANGGLIGIMPAGKLPRDLDHAAFALGIGQIADAVESPFGFHIFQRVQIEELGVSHILIMYHGAQHAPPGVSRTKEEARTQIEALLAQLKAGASLEDLAGNNSDCPSRQQGGKLGVFVRGQLSPEFEKAAWALPVGGISGVVETPFGFHIIRRDSAERVRASHILLSYAGSANPGASRTKEEAKALAEKLLADVKAGADFAKLASENSDCPSREQGGDLGDFPHGQMVKEFDAAAFGMKPGEISGVVETQFGFHIIKRTE